MTCNTKTAAALGFFDGLHTGHRAVIDGACKAGERLGLPVSVLTFRGEPDLPKFGGRRDMCLMTYDDKKEMLHACGVKYVFAYDFGQVRDIEPEKFFCDMILGEMNAAYISCGEDFRFGKGGAGDSGMLAELCKESGIGFELIPAYKIDGDPVSSTHIRELIRGGKISEAVKLLGHPFSYTLPVLHGKQLGRTIGFPTVNQELPAYMARPKRGVYAGYASVSEPGDPVKFGRLYPAITNIGVKPTVKDDETENMETHLIGFDGDIYGRMVRVYLNSYIREERRFESLDELREQLEADRQCALTQ